MEPTATPPRDTTNQSAPIGMERSKKAKRLLAIVLPMISVLVIGITALIVVLASGRTSTETLESLNRATSALNTSSTAVSSELAGNTPGDEKQLDVSISSLESALNSFESILPDIKSDKKDLRLAAEGYAASIRSFLSSEVELSKDIKGIAGFIKLDDLTIDATSSSSLEAYLVELDKLIVVFDRCTTDLAGYSAATTDGEELRGSYVDLCTILSKSMTDLRAAVVASDTAVINTIGQEIASIQKDHRSVKLGSELTNKLGANGDGIAKINTAAEKFNLEVEKNNAKL